MGGGVAFRLAVQHPEMVRRLVLVSAGYVAGRFYPEMLPQQAAVGAAMAEQMKETPMYKSYVAVAPHPEDFPKLLDRNGRVHAQAVRLVGGRQEADDADDARLRRQRHDAARAHREVLPAARRRAEGCGLAARAHVAESPRDPAEHDALRDGPRPEMAETALPFLDGYAKTKTWSEQVSGTK